ncbi:hypothetical protein DFH06DRAFT_1234485 [Mycena polygramma]|nr:hypothetical protein DFH06DRAFT_1234485 [Mycena polygramma]
MKYLVWAEKTYRLIQVLPQLVNIPVDGYAVVYDNINSGTIPRRTQSVNTLDAGTAAQIVPLQRSHSRNHDGEEVNEAVSVLGFELDKFQAECPARIMDGQDVFCINRTGAGKSTLISVPVIMREGTISLVVAPTNFLQRDMVSQSDFRRFEAS